MTPDPLLLALASAIVTLALGFALSRLVPDDYDRLKPQAARVLRRARR